MAAFGVKITPLPPGRIQEIRARYHNLGGALRDMKPAMEIIGHEMAEISKETFNSQGRRGGGSWQALSYKRQEEKAREGLDPRILFATHRLYTSLTEIGSPENRLSIKGKGNEWSVALVTLVPYAKVHWTGSPKRNIPIRRFYKSITSDKERFDRIIRQWMWDAYASVPGETTKAPRGHFS
jgi:hypothetical protein